MAALLVGAILRHVAGCGTAPGTAGTGAAAGAASGAAAAGAAGPTSAGAAAGAPGAGPGAAATTTVAPTPPCPATAALTPLHWWTIALEGRTVAPRRSAKHGFEVDGEPVLVDDASVAYYDPALARVTAFDGAGKETWHWDLARLKGADTDLPRGPSVVAGDGRGALLAWWAGPGKVALRAPGPTGAVREAAVPAVDPGKAPRVLFPAPDHAVLDPGRGEGGDLLVLDVAALAATRDAAAAGAPADLTDPQTWPLAGGGRVAREASFPFACGSTPGPWTAAWRFDARGCRAAALTVAECPTAGLEGVGVAGDLVLVAAPVADEGREAEAQAVSLFLWKLRP